MSAVADTIDGSPGEPGDSVQGTPSTPAHAPLRRRVRLDPLDIARIGWRREQISAPQPRPFDYEARMQEVRPLLKVYSAAPKIAALVPARLSREEAWFWLRCLNATDRSTRSAAGPLPQSADPPAEAWQVRTWAADVASRTVLIYFEVPQALLPFFTPWEILQLILKKASLVQWGLRPVALGFATGIAPYLAQAEMAELRAALGHLYDALPGRNAPQAALLATLLSTVGGGAQLAAHVAGEADGACEQHASHQCQECLGLLAALDSEADFLREAQRLACLPRDGGGARLWLAATQWRALSALAKAALGAGTPQQQLSVVRALTRVEAPEAVAPLLQIESQAPATAANITATWFLRHPVHAVVGLVPLAMEPGELQDPARGRLALLKRHSRSGDLAAACTHLTPEEAAWLQREIVGRAEAVCVAVAAVLPQALRAAFARVRTCPPPTWAVLSPLPPVTVGGMALATGEIDKVLSALKRKPAGPGAQLLQVLKVHADPASLDAFVMELTARWRKACRLPRDRWALLAPGRLGGDGLLPQLLEQLHTWSRRGHRTGGGLAPALLTLNCLGAMATPRALMTLRDLPGTLGFGRRALKLKQAAQALFAQIARDRGLTPEELDDRIVPDCGLDTHGTRLLHCGGRPFTCELVVQGLRVRDAAGRVRERLPAPPRNGPGAGGADARKELRQMQALLRTARKTQAARLEEAMISGRRWPQEEFHSLLLPHPVLRHVLQDLILGFYEDCGPYRGGGRLLQTCRIAEDQRLVGLNGEATRPIAGAKIGIVHPLQLDEAARNAWSEVLSDHHIIPLFAQLRREIHRPDPDDLDRLEITRLRGPKVRCITLFSLLNRHGWQQSPSPATASRAFGARGVSAVIRYSSADRKYGELQELESLCFIPPDTPPVEAESSRLRIRKVDPIALSEALRVMYTILAKAV